MSSRRNPPKIFYGWYVVGAAFLTALYIGGVVFYGFTAFFEPIVEEMAWSYTQVSLAASLRGLETGLLAPLMGMLVDRWGPRRLIFWGAITTAGGLFLLSNTTSLATFYGAFALIAIGVSACTLTVLITAVANWFRRKIGMATGIAICGFGFSGLLVPVIVSLIAVYDWRMSLNILALGTVIIILPLSLIFRHKPEYYGYLPDGQPEYLEYSMNPSPSKVTENQITAKQALRSGTFWRLALSSTYQLMVVSAVITHVMPYLSSIGVSRSISSLIASGIPMMSILGRLGLGHLGDRLNRKLVAAGSFAAMISGLICFAYATANNTWILVLFLILFGIGYGGGNALRPALGRDYFGRRNFGAILGLTVGVAAFGHIVGPAIAGWSYDNWGSYQIVWLLLGVMGVLAIILLLQLSPVKK